MYRRLSILAAALLLAGCGAPEPAPTVTATATATVTATPASAAPSLGLSEGGFTSTAPVVDSLDDLKSTLLGQGLLCDSWSEPIAGISTECLNGPMINAFPNTQEGRDAMRAAATLAYVAIQTQNRDDVGLLLGPNWFIRTDIEGAYSLQRLVGGGVMGI